MKFKMAPISCFIKIMIKALRLRIYHPPSIFMGSLRIKKEFCFMGLSAAIFFKKERVSLFILVPIYLGSNIMYIVRTSRYTSKKSVRNFNSSVIKLSKWVHLTIIECVRQSLSISLHIWKILYNFFFERFFYKKRCRKEKRPWPSPYFLEE